MKKFILLPLLFSSCAGLPKHYVDRPLTQVEHSRCDTLTETSMMAYVTGALVMFTGCILGFTGNEKVGKPMCLGGFAVGASGLLGLGYAQEFTGCPMP